MQDVYERATVNISANAALDSTKGLVGAKERLVSGTRVGNPKNEDHLYVRPIFDKDTSKVSHFSPEKGRLPHTFSTLVPGSYKNECFLRESHISRKMRSLGNAIQSVDANAPFNLEKLRIDHFVRCSKTQAPRQTQRGHPGLSYSRSMQP
jgi:hypothetical protein